MNLPFCNKKFMKTTTVFTLILVVLSFGNLSAQTAIGADPEKWTTYNCKADFSGDTIHLTNIAGDVALLWAKNISLKNGVIELDVKGKDIDGESFVGVAFHSKDKETYDAVYFRPFNFRKPEKKNRSVQYIDMPNNGWDVLREKHPGKYEHAIVPDTDPNNWFHVKIVIRYPDIEVYVNGAKEPTLKITQISERREGKLGLWIDSKEGWFKNVTVSK
jgi:hypothetical protein